MWIHTLMRVEKWQVLDTCPAHRWYSFGCHMNSEYALYRNTKCRNPADDRLIGFVPCQETLRKFCFFLLQRSVIWERCGPTKRGIVPECGGFSKFWTAVLRDLRIIIDETSEWEHEGLDWMSWRGTKGESNEKIEGRNLVPGNLLLIHKGDSS